MSDFLRDPYDESGYNEQDCLGGSPVTMNYRESHSPNGCHQDSLFKNYLESIGGSQHKEEFEDGKQVPDVPIGQPICQDNIATVVSTSQIPQVDKIERKRGKREVKTHRFSKDLQKRARRVFATCPVPTVLEMLKVVGYPMMERIIKNL